MSGDHDYVAREGEALWDHAHRVALLALVGATVRLDIGDIGASRDAGHYLGAYQQSFSKTRSALKDLLRARASMHGVIQWEPTGDGRHRTQLIAESDTETVDTVNEAAARFVAFVVSWQPLMDSIAAHVATVMEPLGPKLPKDMLRLSKAAADKLPDSARRLRKALTEQVAWYVDDVRILRNNFVHHHRVAHLFPGAGSEKTDVTIKKLEHDETTDRFHLDQFISWTFGHFLLFAVGLDEGLREGQAPGRQ